MSATLGNAADRDAIMALIESYADAPRQGSGAQVRKAFVADATMTSGKGFSPMESMFSFVDSSPASPGLTAAVKLLYISGGIATAAVEVRDWASTHYEDIFTFAKTEDGWKIVSKTFRVVND